jgi:hypothetical protein
MPGRCHGASCSLEERIKKFLSKGGTFLEVVEKIGERLRELGAAALHYRGVRSGVSQSETYFKNDCVTANSALWVAARDNPGRPGVGESGSRLAVKSGGPK